MITTIIKQLWNKRRANAWIFIELVLAAYFLWSVTDSLYFYTGNYLTPDGHTAHECYVVDVDYDIIFGEGGTYIKQTPEMRRANYIDIVKAVRSLPEVTYYCIAAKNSIPGSSFSTDKGTLEAGSELADWITFVSLPELGDEQPFATFGIEDAATGETIVLPPARGNNEIYVSEEYAKALYGTAQVKGREVEFGSKHIIAGVYKDYKTSNKYYTPLEHSVITFTPEMSTAGDAYQDIEDRYHLVIRLKEGVNRAAFEKRFNEEIAPTLRYGYFRCHGIKKVSDIQKELMKMTGGEGDMKMNIALSLFALGCVFLGMVGCFWIRANARRSEVALMRSVGASRKRVIAQFLVEAAILVTLAYIIVAPFLIETAKESLYYDKAYEMGYIISFYLEKIPHFIMHTGCNYIIILSTALIGTFIAVNKVIGQSPAEALKD